MMSSKEEMIFGHDVERSQELRLFMSPTLQLLTPDTNITINNNNNNASSSLVGRRPRGRPPSFQNKYMGPIVETHVNRNLLNFHVLEITHGADVLRSVFEYARREGKGICILNGNGMVAHAILRQPTGRIVSLLGRFNIVLISGTILPSPTNAGELTVFLSDTTGQGFGGSVMPPLTALGTVTLMATSFADTTFEKLPSVE
jgi:hypothetical protein